MADKSQQEPDDTESGTTNWAGQSQVPAKDDPTIPVVETGCRTGARLLSFLTAE